MQWYNYLSAFWAGAFLTNFAPHFISGIMGNRFPTPFAKPSGKGLSSPTTNVLWSLFNLLAGYLLFRAAKISADDNLSLISFFAGIVLLSLFCSKHFAGKHSS